MHEYNQGLPRRDFSRPSGVVDAVVCRSSGLLPTDDCPVRIGLSFLAGTVPSETCDQHGPNANSRFQITTGLQTSATLWSDNFTSELQMPTLPPELMQTIPQNLSPQMESPGMGVELPAYNPLLD
jgi:membrane carboxypeptidase/penicillin-binding protein